ncbi:hypothetical protein AYO21_01996 [Fonsecaea monophora]|uniref:Uncharacterized protein n=1 Tax=Fonsecaea monophora TaxID=254056 RepID=A0A177FKT8_9EURO|nr:hypothetical protein AYO21_01996 [Fonsecaea monophora]KAH0844682.1 hypothetical protein FOPE_09949 [Fonsecaea pedrosoi]OAG43769.1 hypothetical protein AYO21_01996 [Fonsecaea monophora]
MQRRPSLVPDLFHIKRITTRAGSPPTTHTEICGTCTDLDSAQKVALRRLEDEGLSHDSMNIYVTNDITQPSSTWQYANNVVVHAETDGEIHEVGIESTPNSLGVRSKPGDGRVEDDLFYVLRTTQSPTTGFTYTEIKGIHLSRQAAVTAARYELVSGEHKLDWYKDYKEEVGVGDRAEDIEGHQVIVTAAGDDGEKYIVSVVHES